MRRWTRERADTDAADERRVRVPARPHRAATRPARSRAVRRGAAGHGIVVRLLPDEDADRDSAGCRGRVEIVDGDADAAAGCELVVVIGGDGTILRAAELAHERRRRCSGVNLGHVGFLAEAEYDDVDVDDRRDRRRGATPPRSG